MPIYIGKQPLSLFKMRQLCEIDLLPKDNRHKDADSYNRSLGYKQEYKINGTATKSSIDNLIRSGSQQAHHIVLRVDSDISFDLLTNAIRGRVNQCKELETRYDYPERSRLDTLA